MQNLDYIVKPVRSSAAPTGSYVAGTTLEQTREYNQLVVWVAYSQDTSTSVEVKVEFSNDDSTYYQETAQSVSSGTATESALEHTFGSTGNYAIPIPITANFIKISTKATGSVGSDTVAVDAVLAVR